ncbi:MAG: AsmA-like C-terminal region-containing protein [Verrucomicrobiota bacterium]|nr:AsmA-like C-terminal region-containing protein [Verrucomicrobiota bacterium]
MALPSSLLDPSKPRRPSGSFYRKWNWRRQIAASGTRLLVAGIFALFIFAGWYLANRGLGKQFRVRVVEELHKRGIEASVGRLTLDPFRGLVAQDLRIFDFHNRETPLALVSEVSLDINYAALLHHQPFLNAIDVRDANLTFPNPFGDPKAPKAQLRQFRARIYFPPEQIFISQAEGFFCGVRLSATGQLLKRADYKPGREMTEAEWRQRMELLQRVATELNSFKFNGGPPALQVKFSGDLSHIEKARVDATLTGDRMQRGTCEIRNFAAAAEWAEQKLNVTQLQWTDAAGDFAGHLIWDGLTKAGKFQAHSTINAKQFADAFGFEKFLADFTFASAPTIELSGSTDLSTSPPRWNAIGRVVLGEFTYRSIPFLSLTSDFSWDGQRTMLREIRLRHATGDLQADFLNAPGDFRLNIESTINPTPLRALASGGLEEFLGEWEWPKSPSVRINLRGTSLDAKTWTGEGSIALQRTRFRGVWTNSATTNVHVADGAITFKDLHVVRDEGIGTGAFTYDDPHKEVRIDHVKTTLRPSDAIYWVDPKLFKAVAPYKFHAVPTLTVNGVVQFHGGKNTHVELGVDAPGGLDYVFLGKTLNFERARANLLITDDRVQLINVDGTVFGGSARGDADIFLAKTDEHYKANITVDHINFPRLTALYFDFKTAQGELSGSYNFAGAEDDARTMRGSGSVVVSNGDVFAIPVFGPLSTILSAIIPGAGYSIARQATASFQVKDGIITTEDFKVSGKLFGMRGHGALYFLDDKLDFDIRVDANGPAILLTPMYSLFEYKGDGKISKPHWHPKNF